MNPDAPAREVRRSGASRQPSYSSSKPTAEPTMVDMNSDRPEILLRGGHRGTYTDGVKLRSTYLTVYSTTIWSLLWVKPTRVGKAQQSDQSLLHSQFILCQRQFCNAGEQYLLEDSQGCGLLVFTLSVLFTSLTSAETRWLLEAWRSLQPTGRGPHCTHVSGGAPL